MIKKTLNYLIFSVASSFIGLLTTIYMARTISQEEIGIIGLYMSFLYISPQLVSFSSNGLISINKVQLSSENFTIFSSKYITFGFMNFVVVFFISCFISFFLKEYWQIFFVLPIVSFLMFIVSFHQAELVQDGRSNTYGMYNLYISIFTSIFTLFFISVIDLSWDGRLFAMLLGQSIVIFVMYKNSFITLQKYKPSIDKNSIIEFIKFGFPLFVGLGAGWVLNQADNYIVFHFFNLKDVGLYAVAYSIGNILNAINQAATNTIVPILYKAFEKKEGSKIVKKLNLYYSIIIIIISLAFGLGAFWYMPIIFGEEYASSADIVFFVALAFGFNGIYRTTGGVIAYYKQNTLQMKLLYLSAVVNVLISIFLIPHFGIVSTAIGTLIAYMILAFTSYFFGWKILRKEEFGV